MPATSASAGSSGQSATPGVIRIPSQLGVGIVACLSRLTLQSVGKCRQANGPARQDYGRHHQSRRARKSGRRNRARLRAPQSSAQHVQPRRHHTGAERRPPRRSPARRGRLRASRIHQGYSRRSERAARLIANWQRRQLEARSRAYRADSHARDLVGFDARRSAVLRRKKVDVVWRGDCSRGPGPSCCDLPRGHGSLAITAIPILAGLHHQYVRV